ncbi:hypothetical protein PFISCL1PPCAC_22061 [Pristionchus fissidentatus]|uniref:Ribosomal protein n=1 Tax=Pristionchus fissidentatus TaxID=1538716 RepID=A0AAV5WJ80_9BILA|nr:hypothetical protein PFISCL1PPCAC_22061 [Pristionchus fissidentatus]
MTSMGVKKVSVECAPHKKDGAMYDSVPCQIIGGDRSRIWSVQRLDDELKKLHILAKLDNHGIRRLVFGTSHTPSLKSADYYNTTCVHGASNSVAAIVANSCFNRVHTTLPDASLLSQIQVYQSEMISKEEDVFTYRLTKAKAQE